MIDNSPENHVSFSLFLYYLFYKWVGRGVLLFLPHKIYDPYFKSDQSGVNLKKLLTIEVCKIVNY